MGPIGQFVVIFPGQNMILAMWAAQSKPEGSATVNGYDFFSALEQALP
jgi:hypothetical protein